jgi:tetratricopeptide (TPR) repeat protein
VRILIDPEDAAQQARDEAEGAVRFFKKLGDERGLSMAWRLWSQLDINECRWEPVREANERALLHARRANDEVEKGEALRSIAGALMHGPTPIPEAIARCEEIYRESTSNRLQSFVLIYLGFLFGLGGRTDEAHEHLARSREIFEELGLAPALGILMKYSGNVELFLANPSAAERVLRRGQRILERLGEKSHLSTVVALLSMAQYEQGRYEEAERLAETAQELGSTDDIGTVATALRVRANVLARKGHPDAGQAMVLEAVRLVEQTDMLWLRGLSWMDMAEFQRLQGRQVEATEATKKALVLFERKGARALSGQARAFLSELGVGR